MTDLTRPQLHTLRNIREAEAKKPTDEWCDTYIREDGKINGNWNTLTLNALENRGFIRIVEVGNFWNDVVILN